MAPSHTANTSVPFVETDCTIEHNGQTFEAGGAVVTDTHIIAYPSDGGILTDWHGNPIGTYRFTAKWPTPRSWFASHMFQVEALVNGVRYTGRCHGGTGCIFRGKRSK